MNKHKSNRHQVHAAHQARAAERADWRFICACSRFTHVIRHCGTQSYSPPFPSPSICSACQPSALHTTCRRQSPTNSPPLHFRPKGAHRALNEGRRPPSAIPRRRLQDWKCLVSIIPRSDYAAFRPLTLARPLARPKPQVRHINQLRPNAQRIAFPRPLPLPFDQPFCFSQAKGRRDVRERLAPYHAW
jgi:hypothetical protein